MLHLERELVSPDDLIDVLSPPVPPDVVIIEQKSRINTKYEVALETTMQFSIVYPLQRIELRECCSKLNMMHVCICADK